jgi:asparagine synthase (glutamine-hydrolysing)
VRERRKLGFPTPTRLWLKGGIGDWVAGLIAGSAPRQLIDVDYAQKLLTDHRAGVADNSRKVWTVAMFCLWWAIFVDRTIRPAPLVTPARPPLAPLPNDRITTVLTGQ